MTACAFQEAPSEDKGKKEAASQGVPIHMVAEGRTGVKVGQLSYGKATITFFIFTCIYNHVSLNVVCSGGMNNLQ